MTDYTELVNELRYCKNDAYCSICSRYEQSRCFETLHNDAAAAIEGLVESVHIRDKHLDELNHHIWKLEAEVAELKRVNKEIFEDLPKRGKWIDDGTKYGIHWFKCSVCGESQDIPTVMLKPYYKYCPVCGAKMEVQDAEM